MDRVMLNEEEIKALTYSTILLYSRNWGQSDETRVSALNKLIDAIGIRATYFQTKEASGWLAEGHDLSIPTAVKFKEELDLCLPRGVEAVQKLIESWANRKEEA